MKLLSVGTNLDPDKPPTQTFLGARHAFLPHVRVTGTRDGPLRTSAWEVRPRSLLRMIAEPEMEAVGTRMYRDKKKPAADLILS